MRTWFDYETKKWTDSKPKRYFVNLVCIETGEKIFIGDTISIIQPRWVGDKIEGCRKTIKLFDSSIYNRLYGERDQIDWKPILISHN